MPQEWFGTGEAWKAEVGRRDADTQKRKEFYGDKTLVRLAAALLPNEKDLKADEIAEHLKTEREDITKDEKIVTGVWKETVEKGRVLSAILEDFFAQQFKSTQPRADALIALKFLNRELENVDWLNEGETVEIQNGILTIQKGDEVVARGALIERKNIAAGMPSEPAQSRKETVKKKSTTARGEVKRKIKKTDRDRIEPEPERPRTHPPKPQAVSAGVEPEPEKSETHPLKPRTVSAGVEPEPEIPTPPFAPPPAPPKARETPPSPPKPAESPVEHASTQEILDRRVLELRWKIEKALREQTDLKGVAAHIMLIKSGAQNDLMYFQIMFGKTSVGRIGISSNGTNAMVLEDEKNNRMGVYENLNILIQNTLPLFQGKLVMADIAIPDSQALTERDLHEQPLSGDEEPEAPLPETERTEVQLPETEVIEAPPETTKPTPLPKKELPAEEEPAPYELAVTAPGHPPEDFDEPAALVLERMKTEITALRIYGYEIKQPVTFQGEIVYAIWKDREQVAELILSKDDPQNGFRLQVLRPSLESSEGIEYVPFEEQMKNPEEIKRRILEETDQSPEAQEKRTTAERQRIERYFTALYPKSHLEPAEGPDPRFTYFHAVIQSKAGGPVQFGYIALFRENPNYMVLEDDTHGGSGAGVYHNHVACIDDLLNNFRAAYPDYE